MFQVKKVRKYEWRIMNYELKVVPLHGIYTSYIYKEAK